MFLPRKGCKSGGVANVFRLHLLQLLDYAS
jgi:hypothetical protein